MGSSFVKYVDLILLMYMENAEKIISKDIIKNLSRK